MPESAFIQNLEQADWLLKHWKLGLELESASKNSLPMVQENQMETEGCPYCLLPLIHSRVGQFIFNEQPKLHWYWRKQDLPFLYFLQNKTSSNTWFKPTFVAGFPTLVFKNGYGQKCVGSLFNFVVPDTHYPKDSAPYTFHPPPLGLICAENNLNYLLDSQLLQEIFGFAPSVLRGWHQRLKAESQLKFWQELAVELQPKPTTQDALLMQIYEGFKQRLPDSAQLLPSLLVQAKTHGDPTLQLQKDLNEIQIENALSELKTNHPAWLYLNGKNHQKSLGKTLLAQHHQNNLTPSQANIIRACKKRNLTVVQGPPGSGKTFTLQSLFAERFLHFVTNLHSLQDRNQDLHNLTLLASTNNQAVDKGLAGLDLDGLLPVALRLGNRHKMVEHTLPFLENYLKNLHSKNPQSSLEQLGVFKHSLQQALAEPKTCTNWQRYKLARQTLDAWVSANRDLVMPFLERIIEEIQRYQHIRSLRNSKNMELLATVFPLFGTTLLSMRNSFPLQANSIGMCLVDEAGQCFPSAIFPLLFRAQQAVILGDSYQLEPIFNLQDSDWHFDLAGSQLPKKVQQNFLPSVTNNRSAQQVAIDGCTNLMHFEEHFRCHQRIIQISIDLCGYNLKTQTQTSVSKWLDNQPLWFWDIQSPEKRYAESWFNELEAQSVVSLVQSLVMQGLPLKDMAVLTPFRGQFYRLLALFAKAKLHVIRGDTESQTKAGVLVGTIHRLQGGERPVVLLSNVLHQKSPDFLNAKVNLLNVAVSRAQQHFVFVGCLKNLKQGVYGRVLHQHLQEHGKNLSEIYPFAK